MSPEKSKTLNLFIVSDATGTTAEMVATSVLAQFTGAQVYLRRFPFVRNEEQVRDVVNQAPAGACIIVFTFVSPELSRTMLELGLEKELTVVDLINPLMQTITDILEYEPKHKPGLFRVSDDDLHQVHEAIHYTLRHDDGMGQDTLHQADLIILGVSRTGKTPTSIFLSCRKLKVANIPIISGVPLPKTVITAPAKKVGFRIDHERLVRLRAERGRRMGTGPGMLTGYLDEKSVFDELVYADQLYKRIPNVRTIDVTERSIEEISDWITRYVL